MPLYFCASLYLSLPLMVFGFSWLSFPFNIMFVALALSPIIILFLADRFNHYPVTSNKTLSSSLFCLGISVIVILLMGGNSIFGSLPHFDWNKHLGMLQYLHTYSWPVYTWVDPGETQPYFLRFYFAWYLVPALFSPVFSVEAFYMLELWTGLGVLITLLLIYRLVGWSLKLGAFAVLLFMFFEGVDILGVMFFGEEKVTFGDHIQRWIVMDPDPSAKVFKPSYQGFFSQLFFAPHQALPGWILTLLLLNARKEKYLLFTIPILTSLAILWSPFVVLGIVPIYVVIVYEQFKSVSQYKYLAVSCFISFFIAALLIPWLTSGSANLPYGTNFNFKILEFLFIEIFIGCFVLVLVRPNLAKDMVFLTSLLILCTLPFFYLGGSNDLVMRASIPALTVLSLSLFMPVRVNATALAIKANKLSMSKCLLFSTYLLICSIAPILEISRSFIRSKATPVVLREIPDLMYSYTHLRQYFAKDKGNIAQFFF